MRLLENADARRRSDGDPQPGGDPARGSAPRNGRGDRRALARAAGGRRRDEQERALRPFRVEGGAAARDDRDRATPILPSEVVEPALSRPAGWRLAQLRAFLGHLEGGVFPGGCFFASVPPRWTPAPAPCVTSRSGSRGVVRTRSRPPSPKPRPRAHRPGEDPAQLAFELDAYLLLANAQYVATGETGPLDRARRAIDRRLAAAAA